MSDTQESAGKRLQEMALVFLRLGAAHVAMIASLIFLLVSIVPTT
ncbi:MAG: hypothetical protein ABSA97_03415 [Verrucomicrobiia bacterium]